MGSLDLEFWTRIETMNLETFNVKRPTLNVQPRVSLKVER